MAKHLVLVAGNIGAGKTSLTERIGARLGWHTGYESVADNPYLPDFYADMRSWAFHLQVFFLVIALNNISKLRTMRVPPFLTEAFTKIFTSSRVLCITWEILPSVIIFHTNACLIW